MGVWHYAFFFPGPDQQLNTVGAVDAWHSDGFEVQKSFYHLAPIDDDGHLCEGGEEVYLDKPFHDSLASHLRKEEQLLAEMTKLNVASKVVTTLACSFETKAANPHMSFGWHKGLFEQLPREVQADHWMAIKNAAKASAAAYVVLVVEASDNFEDRFLEVDGKRWLDTECHHSYGHGIWSVWVDHSLGGQCPEGVADTVGVDIGDGVFRYEVR